MQAQEGKAFLQKWADWCALISKNYKAKSLRMDLEIINQELRKDIYGFAGKALNKDYAGAAFSLMNKMWGIVKAAGLKNKGTNIWVYEAGENLFAGVELEETPPSQLGLEHKHILLLKYAYYKHIGPYQLIKKSGKQMRDALQSKGLETCDPYIEMYGHWNSDENKLETELLICLR